ncbi:MAG: endonuclease/exonuclease/phosphatase family protein [Candidatus Cryptobacteroides sp.]
MNNIAKIGLKVAQLLALPLIISCSENKQAAEFTVLQWNIWQEGTVIPGGYESIVDEIVRLKPDFVTFSEVRNYNGTRFCDRITESLREKGETYYSFLSYDSGLLSRYPITDSLTVFPLNDDHGSVYRMTSTVKGREIAVYTAHLDYLNCAYYNVYGYHGSTWEEIPYPDTVGEVLAVNDSSLRDDAVRNFIECARKDIEAGRFVVLGGDLNEPSHLDWTRETKDLYGHRGMIVPWTVTTLLDNAGFVDTYRTVYPDPVTHPGFTIPADTPLATMGQLAWAPKSDERERIDYIFYYPDPSLKLVDAVIFGPDGSVVESRREKETSEDPFLLPAGVWPSDHKGLLVTFRVE